MDTTYQEQLVRSVMLIVRLVLVLSPLNVQDAQRDSFWMLPQTLLFQRSEILLIFVELFVIRTQKDFIMFWQGITVPMSARIDHHSLVITGQMLTNQFADFVTVLAQLALDIITDNAQLVSMAITWMAKRVRNAMLIVPHALEVYQHNVLDAIKATSWMSPQTRLGKLSRIPRKDADLFAHKMLLDGTTFLRVITVPMSARIAHPNLEII